MVRVVNNLITGTKAVLTGPAENTNNLVTEQPGFADVAHYDYRLTPRSPALGTGIEPGNAGTFTLTPKFYYRAPLAAMPRHDGEKLNVGACAAAGL